MTNKTWIGGASGSFTIAGDWSPGGEPGVGDQAVIDTASTVDLAIGNGGTVTVDSLNLTGGAELDIDNAGINTGNFIIGGGSVSTIFNSVLQVANTDMFAQGTIANEGTIRLLSGAQLQTSGSTLALSAAGSGEVQLQGAAIGGRIAVGGTGTFDTLTLTDQFIDGFGSIGRNGFLDTLNINMVSGDTIDADAGAALRMDANITQGNFSKLLADGGTLVLSGSVNNAPPGSDIGEVQASTDPGSLVELDHADITGGSLLGGQFEVISDATLDGGATDMGVSVTTFAVDAGATLLLRGHLLGDPANPATLDPGAGTLVLTGADVANLDLAGGANILLAGALSTIDNGSTLDNGITIGNGQTLAFAGTITNPIAIALAGPGATMEIESGTGPVQLSGGGEVTLSDPGDRITGTTATAQFENIDNTIIGLGSIDNLATLTVDAGASIDASGGGTLVLNAANIVSAGFLGAEPGSTLEILGKLTNTGNLGGLIIYGAPLAGLINGTLDAGATLVVHAPGAGVDTLTNHGKITVSADAVLTLTGDTDNTGIIQLSGTGAAHPASIVLGGMLSGGGTIVFGPADVVTSVPGTQFVNVDNVIEGSGNLGTGAFNFVNHGIVDANVAANPLLVDPAAPTVQNLALMEATAGGTLQIVGDLIDTDLVDGSFVNSGIGTLLASGAGAVVALLGGSVLEGLIDSTGGGQVQVQGAETLLLGGIVIVGEDTPPYARDTALTSFADLRILAGQTLTLAAPSGGADSVVMNNSDTISLRGSAGDGATLVIAAATVELDSPIPGVTSGGPGGLTLNNAADRIIGAAVGDVLFSTETISGFGQLGAGLLNITNGNTIDANVAGQTLFVQPASDLVDEGILRASAGTLVLLGTISQFSNTGLLDADGTGVIKLGGLNADGVSEGVVIVAGFITSSAGGVLETNGAPVLFDGTGSGGFLNLVAGTVAVHAGDTLTLSGGLANSGTVALQGVAGNGATLLVGGAGVNLEFSGAITLAGTADVITGTASGDSLINQQNTITGSGNIGGGVIGLDNMAGGGVIDATAAMVIDTGAHVMENTGLVEAIGGTLTIKSAIDNDGGVFANVGVLVSNGRVEVDGAVTGTGVLGFIAGPLLQGTGTLVLDGSVGAGQSVAFSGFGAQLVDVGPSTGIALNVTYFQRADTIDLENVLATGSSFTAGVMHVSVGALDVADLQVPTGYALSDFALVPDGNHGTDVVIACFATGARILTATGEVQVESLRVGDAVATLRRGGFGRIEWLGHRRVDCRRHADPRAVWPIRVQAGAFGPATPHADLLLSPDHAVFIGGVLIPVRYLVNDRTVVQEARDAVTYWHVELASHDILLAEGLPAESYLDTGNRAAFADSDEHRGFVHRMEPAAKFATAALA